MDIPSWVNNRTAGVMQEMDQFFYQMETSSEEGWQAMRNFFLIYNIKMDASSLVNVYIRDDKTHTLTVHIRPRGHTFGEFHFEIENVHVNYIYFKSLKETVLWVIRHLFPIMIHNLDQEKERGYGSIDN